MVGVRNIPAFTLLQPISHNFHSFAFPDGMHVARNELTHRFAQSVILAAISDIQPSVKQITQICQKRLGRSLYHVTYVVRGPVWGLSIFP